MTRIVLDGIELPADLQWVDEFTGWAVGQYVSFTLSGALVVQESARQAGRPITLQTTRDGDAYVAPIPLLLLRLLQESETTPRALPMTLVVPAHNGGERSFNVLWRRTEGRGLEARQINFAVPALDGDNYEATIRLMTV